MEEHKINYAFIWTILITVLGWGMTFGVCQNKIENNAKEIQDIRARQLVYDKNNLEISRNLAELNSKMDLLLQGKIKIVNE